MPRRSPVTPYDMQVDLYRNWMGLVMLAAETQAVIAYRVWGMAGLWAVAPGENRRMVAEKLPAFAEAAMAGTLAGLGGAQPAQMLAAAVGPLRKRTRANSRRLARRGLKAFGPKFP